MSAHWAFVGGASVFLGVITVRPGVDAAVVEAAFFEELERLAAEAPSDDEMERAKALIEADELGSLARVEERARPPRRVRGPVR